ncbi:thioredoxin-disulfide reductase [bacterium]|nr:thioredoxin-disulfide reductase [bacterium]
MINKTNKENVIILGSGPAGLTAGIYLARAGFKPLLIEGMQPGGWLTTTSLVENYPGFDKDIEGVELMMKMKKQAEKYGCQVVSDVAKKVDISKKGLIKVSGLNKEYSAQALIISTGTNPRKLGINGEEKLWGRGVAICATCDGALYQNKKVIIIGGGNTAFNNALFLTKFASEVKILNRNDQYRVEKETLDEVITNKKIKIIPFAEIKEFLGSEKLEKVIIFNNKTKIEEKIDVDGVFLSIGHTPNTKLFKNQLDLTKKGYIKIIEPWSTKTSQNNVFACGDVMDYKYQQAVISAGTGCMAALDAQKYLDSIK